MIIVTDPGFVLYVLHGTYALALEMIPYDVFSSTVPRVHMNLSRAGRSVHI